MDNQFDLTGFYDDQIMTGVTNQFDMANNTDITQQSNSQVYNAGMRDLNNNIHNYHVIQ